MAKHEHNFVKLDKPVVVENEFGATKAVAHRRCSVCGELEFCCDQGKK